MTPPVTNYSNREIDRMFSEIKEQLDRIEHQTTRTNGRVSLLERWRTGIAMCIGIVAFVVIPLIVYIYTTRVNAVNYQISQIQKNVSSPR